MIRTIKLSTMVDDDASGSTAAAGPYSTSSGVENDKGDTDQPSDAESKDDTREDKRRDEAAHAKKTDSTENAGGDA